ncbi:MAG TPA: glycerophosphoryl diester phosphodiesterase membrane domain-containing protein [Terracidiphilus sp.]|nr:glycerophosphoryl diester phosphodiesterase membrane domain-containing protein [Terracidiphilus sp.]
MSETLRPMTLGDILDRTIQLYRRNFVSFAGIAAVPTVVILAFMVPLLAAVGTLGVFHRKAAPLNGALLAAIVAGSMIFAIVILVATVVSQAALIRAVTGAHTGQRLSIGEALGSVRPHFGRYLGVLFLQGIWVGLIPAVIAGVVLGVVFALARAAGGGAGSIGLAGFAAFLIVAAAIVIIVLRGLTYSLALPACIAETKPAWESLQRSKKLSKGTRGRIFLMFLLIWVVAMALSTGGYIVMLIVMAAAALLGKGGVGGIIAIVAGEIINLLVNFALQVLITPVYMAALVLFYYDQRIRMEGYDIEWMMERAGLTVAQPEIASGAAADAETMNG